MIEAVSPRLVSQTKGLEHTAHSMRQVHTEQISSDDVENGYERIGKTGDHHVVHIVHHQCLTVGIDLGFSVVDQRHLSWILSSIAGQDDMIVRMPWNRSHGIMQKVENQEAEDDQAGHDHGSRCQGGLNRCLGFIVRGPCFFVLNLQRNRRPDVR